MAYTVRELSLRTFPDFETLAIKQGGCWCMFYQRSKPVGRGATSDQWKRINRRDKRTFVRQGRSHAILVFEGGTPGMFGREGFETVAGLGTSGVLMRKTIRPRPSKKP